MLAGSDHYCAESLRKGRRPRPCLQAWAVVESTSLICGCCHLLHTASTSWGLIAVPALGEQVTNLVGVARLWICLQWYPRQSRDARDRITGWVAGHGAG